MHNWPELPVGRIALRAGPLMGAYDIFEIVATGRGAHAAMPHLGRDPMPFAAHVINALQTIVARNLHPLEAGRGERHAGAWRRHLERHPAGSRAARHRALVPARGAGPDRAPHGRDRRRPRGHVRHGRDAALRAALSGHDQHAAETAHALAAATALLGADNVDTDPMPSMGSEDFAFMLQEKPGCYVWLGGGRGPETPNLHNPHYDFNDDALAIGASYWVTLAEQQLAIR